ncbi:Phage integrase family protein [Curtobacterium sp. 9128]|uniref:tyrosine-type recombinase/integrase n=1 Tax=Curtobacterium sp. 9128 TaxID=1793722 RepID=UPI0007D732E5|nr:site-specific integrase [Curtobacterium sp. 9128]SBN64411.1 Phage integrase family protein [Curtobacterium sp. 9128]
MTNRTRGKGEGAVYRVPADRTLPLEYWTASIELPGRDGKRRRKVVRSKDKATVLKQLRALQRDLERSGDLPTASVTLGAWMKLWYDEIAVHRLAPKTAAGYKSAIRQHIIPAIGNVRLDKLEPKHVRDLNRAIRAKGRGASTALQAHRILGVALRDAEREGRVTRNVTTLLDAPRRAHVTLVTLDAAAGVRILERAAREDVRMGSRWAAALLTGARQGELLGLEVDRVTDRLDLSWQLQRLTWSHGCNPRDPEQPRCGRKRGTDCPDRFLRAPEDHEHRHLTGGLWLSRPKSRAGWRDIPLVEPLRSIIERRLIASASEPNPHGLLWTAERKRTPYVVTLRPLDGSPIDPAKDNYAWHALLTSVGVRDARLHDARHTTATLLYEANVPEPIIMEILGQSTLSVTRGYRSRGNHALLGDALAKVSALLTSDVPPDAPQLAAHA